MTTTMTESNTNGSSGSGTGSGTGTGIKNQKKQEETDDDDIGINKQSNERVITNFLMRGSSKNNNNNNNKDTTNNNSNNNNTSVVPVVVSNNIVDASKETTDITTNNTNDTIIMTSSITTTTTATNNNNKNNDHNRSIIETTINDDDIGKIGNSSSSPIIDDCSNSNNHNNNSSSNNNNNEHDINYLASLECLRLLVKQSSMPKTKKKFHEFLRDLELYNSDNCPFIAWLLLPDDDDTVIIQKQQCNNNNNNVSQRRKRKALIIKEQLRFKFLCLGGNNDKYTWSKSIINNILYINQHLTLQHHHLQQHKVTKQQQQPTTKLSKTKAADTTNSTMSMSQPPPTTTTTNDTRISNATTTMKTAATTTTIRTIRKIELIETIQQLTSLQSLWPFDCCNNVNKDVDNRPSVQPYFVAVDCEGVPDNIYLIQIATGTEQSNIIIYIFDCIKLDPKVVCQTLLQNLFMNKNIIKLFHDVHEDAVAIQKIGGIEKMYGLFDTQLLAEYIKHNMFIGFNQMLELLHGSADEQFQHPLKHSMKKRMDNNNNELFAQRPIQHDILEYAALDVELLLRTKSKIINAVNDNDNNAVGEGLLSSLFMSLQRASDKRANAACRNQGMRSIGFNGSDDPFGVQMVSMELFTEIRPNDLLHCPPLVVSDDTSILLDLLPEDLITEQLQSQTQYLSDVVLDKGRAPHAWIKGERVFLGSANDDRIVESTDIDAIVTKLGGFGSDNRAGLEKQLHRISAIRNRQSDIIGLTMRVGRHVTGNATIITDLLFSSSPKSILFLGEPGCGKTTIVREVSRLLAERFNVCIVDTSNEIAGDGDIPHPCVGHSRRMMVPSLDKQGSVMIECVQNHTPEVMVIDEIGRPSEVDAARTCKERGVRLIASAHGDFRKLVKNPKLRGLIGGVETVTLGDMQAKIESRKSPSGGANITNNRIGIQKLKSQRSGSPVFDIIVELRRGAFHEWRIVMDVAKAVDEVLEGLRYRSERRSRDPSSGSIMLELERN